MKYLNLVGPTDCRHQRTWRHAARNPAGPRRWAAAACRNSADRSDRDNNTRARRPDAGNRHPANQVRMGLGLFSLANYSPLFIAEFPVRLASGAMSPT